LGGYKDQSNRFVVRAHEYGQLEFNRDQHIGETKATKQNQGKGNNYRKLRYLKNAHAMF